MIASGAAREAALAHQRMQLTHAYVPPLRSQLGALTAFISGNVLGDEYIDSLFKCRGCSADVLELVHRPGN